MKQFLRGTLLALQFIVTSPIAVVMLLYLAIYGAVACEGDWECWKGIWVYGGLCGKRDWQRRINWVKTGVWEN